MSENGPYTSVTETFPFTAAPRIDEELQHQSITYGDVYTKTVVGVPVPYRIKTTTVAFRFRLCFLTQAAAQDVSDALTDYYAAIGAALTPARNIATVVPEIGYDNLAYDVVVNYSNSVSVEEAVV